ncbi:hypothetical protein V8B97DRAFT_1887107 [Scleroderma yunnanense]
MSLPTPPSTSHRDRDLRLPGSRVAWSQQNQYFVITNSPKGTVPLPKHLEHPARSILKKNSQTFLPVPYEDTRQITPEPEDPLANLTYLTWPVTQIINPESSLRDLIEAYSILHARIRAAVTDSTDGDASWPLFQPLRKNTQAFVDAVVRDLGRALLEPDISMIQDDDPPATEYTEERDLEESRSLLPSPRKSPKKKKKKGMSAAQVKIVRDLCTATHAVLRLLSIIFTLPAVHQLFTEVQLRDMLTQVLAIPMAETLPTPNARKTCALSIWLLQIQRLPEEVLLPARDRIAFALRRGMEGELGKEGKKGSACDGLKAIHDLTLYQPSTFVPVFAELIPSILSNLLAPTVALRVQACHALGGFVLGYITLPPSSLQTRVSDMVATFLTAQDTSPLCPTKTPTKAKPEPYIVRTLRTTLNTVDPTHVAHGPVWALSVLASFVVLLGPKLCTDIRLTRIVSALLTLAIRNKKSSVRAIGCLLWRCITWAYVQPPSKHNSEEGGPDASMKEQDTQLARENFWKLVRSVVEMGVGVSTVTALISDEYDDEDCLKKALELVKNMIHKGGQACEDGMEIARIMVSFENPGGEWTQNKLLPHSLFSSSPGLLTAEYSGLSNVVRPIFEECPQFTDIRSLTREELSRDWVFDELIDIWKMALGSLRMPETYELPSEITGIWKGLMKANVAYLLDAGDHDSVIGFGARAAGFLVDIICDQTYNFAVPPGVVSPLSSPVGAIRQPNHSQLHCSNASIKLRVVHELWEIMRAIFPSYLLHAGGAKLLEGLMEDEECLTELDDTEDARTLWACLCAEVLLICDIDELRKFWARRARTLALMPYEAGAQSLVWRCFVEKWKGDEEGTWEGAVVLLGVPFDKSNAWELNNEDFGVWDDFLRYAMDKAGDGGTDSLSFLDRVAEVVARMPCPVFASFTRVADLLLTQCDMADAKQIPSNIFEFVNDMLLSTYPPEPRNLKPSTWLIATLTRIIDVCPLGLRLELLEAVQDGVSMWVSDDCHVFSEDEYTFDVLPLYQTALLSLKELPGNMDVLTTLSPLLHSVFCGRGDAPAVKTEAFTDFWTTAFASCDEPENGWPEDIRLCLRYSGLLEGDVASEDFSSELSEPPSDSTVCVSQNDNVPETPLRSSVTLPDEFDVESICTEVHPDCRDGEDTSPIIGRLRPASFTPLMRPEESCIKPLSLLPPVALCTTPTKAPSRATTPPRPQKPVMTPESYQSLVLRAPAETLPICSNTPSTPKRTPCSRIASSVSPSKRVKLQDKENISPRPTLSVMERIFAKSSPGPIHHGLPASVLGKRQMEDSPYDSVQKRGRTAPPPATFIRSSITFPSSQDSDTEEELAVAATLFTPVGANRRARRDAAMCPNESSSQGSPVVSRKRKRQRLIFDAVVVPPLADVRRQWQSQRRASAEDIISSQTSPCLHRTVSLPRLSNLEGDSLPQLRVKRLKRLEDAEFSESAAPSVSSLKALDDVVIAGSDDSIVLASNSKFELPSSDDDPYIGQVSPRHLASPAPRRHFDFDHHPSSDGALSSPSREIITRRQQRFGPVAA